MRFCAESTPLWWSMVHRFVARSGVFTKTKIGGLGPSVALSLVALTGCAGTASQSASFDAAEAQLQMEPSAEAEAPSFDGSVDAYLDYAVQRRPELRSSLEQWRAARRRVEAVDNLPDPKVSYGLYVRHVETRVGPQRHRVGVQQPIPMPGKPAAAEAVAQARAEVEEQRFEAQLLDVRWQVITAYWDLWEVSRLRELHDQHTAIVEALAASARSRVETGSAMVSDVGQTELVLSRTIDMVGEASEMRKRATTELARSVGVDPGRDDLPLAADVPAARRPAEPEDDLVAAATAHPRIAAIARRRTVAERQATRAMRQRLPDFGVGVDWIETGPALDPDMPESGKDPVIAMFSVKVPLWSGEVAAAADAARAEEAARAADEEAAKRDAEAAVRKTLASIRNSARVITLYETTLIPQAEAVLGSVRGSYETGKSGVASLLLAQNELLDLRLKLAMARADHERQWALLERIVGRPVAGEEIR